jgi:PAS domain S-box-containing protein
MTGQKMGRQQQDFRRWFEVLSGTIEELNNFPQDEDLFPFIAGTLKQLVPEDTIIIVNTFDQDTKAITFHAAEGLGSRQPEVEDILSHPLDGLAFPVPDHVLPDMLSGECHELRGGLTELTFGRISSETCKKIEAMPFFGKIYSAGICWKGRLNGAAIFILPRGVELENQDLITFFIRQIAAFLSRRDAEAAQKESEQFTREIILNAKEGIIVYDRNLNYLVWNPVMESLTGIPASEVKGKNGFELFPHLKEQNVDLLLQRALKGETVRSADVPYHVPRTKKSGWVSGIYSPYYNCLGEISGVIGIIHDITERKRAEEKLTAAFSEIRVSEEKFSAAFHSSAALMAISTKGDGKFIDVNETFLKTMGFSRDEVIGKQVADLEIFQNPEDRVHALRLLEERGEVRNLDVPVNTRDGVVQYGLFSVDNIMVGGVPCLLTTMVDITEQKILEKEMEFHEKEVMRFSQSLDAAIRKLNLLSSITRHDINNQLTVLMGYLEMLEMQQPDSSTSGYFRKVTAAAQRISTMIQFTKTYESIGVMAPAWQDIRALGTSAAKEAPLGKIVLKNDIPEGAEVFADPLIIKVFYNLMDNAVRYGEKITTIRISAENYNGSPVIVVDDDGTGIPAEEKEKIFERGYGKNTGLGLFLTREILGITSITIRETGIPGKGARFEIAVPTAAYRLKSAQ